jgi:hypothetical protein
MAIQFSKPAMVIPGRWQQERDGSRSLLYLVEEFTEEICQQHGLQVVVRRNVRQREYTLREGDIVALDATRSLVTVLGQTRDIVSLQDGMRLLREENRSFYP